MSTVDAGQARAVDDLPRLAVDRVQMQTWARELSMIVEELRQWRERRDRVAEDAARRHDGLELSAREPVARPLTDREAQVWRDRADNDDVHTLTRFDVGTGRGLRVRVGPVDSGRWVLDAQVDQLSEPTGSDTAGTGAADPGTASSSGDAGPPVTVERVAVSCRTEADARALANELAAAGPDVEVLRTLRQRAAQRAARQAAAAGQVRESDPELLERVREEVRRWWRPELAERVIISPAFGRFARGLGELESHGATIDDVLRRQGLQDKLSQPLVRDPAAFGAAMFRSLLTTIDGEVVAEAGAPGSAHSGAREQAGRRPSPHPREAGPAGSAGGGPATGRTPEEQAWLRSITEDTVWPALAGALGEPVARQVRASRGYERLAQELAARHAVGWSLDALLTGLPADRIISAADPGGYLRGIVGRRVEQTGPDQGVGTRRPAGPDARPRVDQHAMAEIVQEAFPRDIAKRLLECPAWPALCTQMARAGTLTGADPEVAQLLAGLPLRGLARARKPAAYAAELLRREVAVRRGADPAAETDAEDARLGRGSSPGGALASSRALDRIGLDDLATPPAPTEARSSSGERLSPLVQAQLLLTASRALKRRYLGQDVVALRGRPGAADPAWVHEEVAARGLVYTSADGRRHLRSGYRIADLAQVMDLPRAPLYAAVVLVAAQRDPRIVVPAGITNSTLHGWLGPIPVDKAIALMHTLATHGVVSAGGDRDIRQALITPEQVPEVLRRLDDPTAEVEAAAHRHAAAQQGGVAADAERDAALERGAGDAEITAGAEPDAAPDVPARDVPAELNGVESGSDGAINPGHARVDDNLAAAARARGAEERGSAAAAALRAQVVNTPHDSRAAGTGRGAGAVPVKAVPKAAKVTLERGRRR